MVAQRSGVNESNDSDSYVLGADLFRYHLEAHCSELPPLAEGVMKPFTLNVNIEVTRFSSKEETDILGSESVEEVDKRV